MQWSFGCGICHAWTAFKEPTDGSKDFRRLILVEIFFLSDIKIINAAVKIIKIPWGSFSGTQRRARRPKNYNTQFAMHILVERLRTSYSCCLEPQHEASKTAVLNSVIFIIFVYWYCSAFWQKCPEKLKISYRWICTVYLALKALLQRKRCVN